MCPSPPHYQHGMEIWVGRAGLNWLRLCPSVTGMPYSTFATMHAGARSAWVQKCWVLTSHCWMPWGIFSFWRPSQGNKMFPFVPGKASAAAVGQPGAAPTQSLMKSFYHCFMLALDPSHGKLNVHYVCIYVYFTCLISLILGYFENVKGCFGDDLELRNKLYTGQLLMSNFHPIWVSFF